MRDSRIKRRNVGIPKFLCSLRKMVDNFQSNHIITWSIDGMSVDIFLVEALTEEVLPQHFKHKKYSSFQRQLNYFAFKKTSRAPISICTFRHPLFSRDNPSSLGLIKRVTGTRGLVIRPLHISLHDTSPLETFSPSLQLMPRTPSLDRLLFTPSSMRNDDETPSEIPLLLCPTPGDNWWIDILINCSEERL
jgi:hypothetical protein